MLKLSGKNFLLQCQITIVPEIKNCFENGETSNLLKSHFRNKTFFTILQTCGHQALGLLCGSGPEISHPSLSLYCLAVPEEERQDTMLLKTRIDKGLCIAHAVKLLIFIALFLCPHRIFLKIIVPSGSIGNFTVIYCEYFSVI